MNDFQAIAIMVALFALRFLLPVALMIAIGYGMNKLADRWEAEEQAQPEAKPAIALPVLPTPAATAAANVPCWVYKNCDAATRARCPAYRQPSLACWVALLRAEGRLPAKCAGCARYTGMPALAAGD